MYFKVLKNVKIDECLQIFIDNNYNFVFDKNCLSNNTFIKYVCTLNNQVVGYAVVYPYNDFIKKENFNCNYIAEKNSIYIWHIITHKKFRNKGIAKLLYDSIFKDYDKFNIYCVVDKDNIPSLNLHTKLHFQTVDTFSQFFHNKLTKFYLLKHKK